MVKNSKIRTAMKHCANWDSGDCIGCMMSICNKVIIFRILSKFANKPCQVDKKCGYFNNIVVPGVSNGI